MHGTVYVHKLFARIVLKLPPQLESAHDKGDVGRVFVVRSRITRVTPWDEPWSFGMSN